MSHVLAAEYAASVLPAESTTRWSEFHANAAVLLVIIGTVYDRVDMFVDFAIAYALLNFVGAIVVSRYLNRTISLKEMEAKEKKAKA